MNGDWIAIAVSVLLIGLVLLDALLPNSNIHDRDD